MQGGHYLGSTGQGRWSLKEYESYKSKVSEVVAVSEGQSRMARAGEGDAVAQVRNQIFFNWC